MSMTSKHFINNPTDLVLSALKAVKYTNPSLSVDEANKIVYYPSDSPNNVALVSGGGAGHEPSFTSFVGEGMLRAAVSGTIFASPSVRQINNCISRRVGANAGVLLIVMNYTGDVLHFGLATEKARASGRDVEVVVVGEDVGVGRAKSGKVGRRGMAGTVLVHKICGALAATGASLKDTAALAELVAKNLVTLGSSLEHVHIPGTAKMEGPAMLDATEIEMGMGIHNERGSMRVKGMEIGTLVQAMLRQLLDRRDKDRNYLDVRDGAEWVLMVNNLGGVSPLEMGGITAVVVEKLAEEYSINPERIYSGTFMTSLNGLGFSISLLRIIDTGLGKGKDMLSLLDASHETLGWTPSVRASTWASPAPPASAPIDETEKFPTSHLIMDPNLFKHTLTQGLRALIAAEPFLTRYDTLVGDGDCGTGLKRGAQSLQHFLDTGGVRADPVDTIFRLALLVEDSMDGTSGALVSIYLHALVKALRDSPDSSEVPWGRAALQALTGLGRYTAARPGDRTMMDALVPFLVALGRGEDLKTAAKKAREGAESTRGMRPKLGRTVYIDRVGNVPDPGAIGVAVFAEGMAQAEA
ncbi:Dak1 domain-containing protein [Sphaerosporella brunnea]|uniref:Dak1 domain-containing protein n=1 Tax=Sphaerosporella brunnea TaxID=1250544 RepID=A0A5J5ERH9_9PEZI|nr:Dak1 domain-containing protein [Sphaerosporella brunnea]